MAELDIAKTSTTDLENSVEDYSVSAEDLDYASTGKGETYHYFAEATKNFGYYKKIPELKKAIDALALWAVGKGWESEVKSDEVILNTIDGWGEDTIVSILWNLVVVKKIVGDSFAEIIREDDLLLNLKPISPERVRIVIDPQGRIKRYDVINNDGKWKSMEKEDILHLCNDRVGDEIHGVSVIDSCKWVIDARNEAMEDERKIKHRELALGVLYIDTENETKRDAIIKQYGDAVKNGEVLVLPKDTAELKDSGVSPKERLAWIQYLGNFFYQAVGVPKVIATSEGFTEAGGKVGFLTFEPVYTFEQTLLEGDMWNQLSIKIKFNRPPSLSGVVQEDETKNTGQLGFQPKDTEATITRE